MPRDGAIVFGDSAGPALDSEAGVVESTSDEEMTTKMQDERMFTSEDDLKTFEDWLKYQGINQSEHTSGGSDAANLRVLDLHDLRLLRCHVRSGSESGHSFLGEDLHELHEHFLALQ